MIRFLILAAALCLAACSAPPPAFHATDITGADYGKTFTLTDHTGKARALKDFRGKAVTLFFGYTQCPDVCPTSLATMAEVMNQLGPEADRVQVLFVTLDPGRDTAELLAQYVPVFDARFLGLYGDEAATAATAKEFRVFYRKSGDVASGHYTIDHTAATYVFDPAGKLRLYVKHGETAENIAADLKRLLAGS